MQSRLSVMKSVRDARTESRGRPSSTNARRMSNRGIGRDRPLLGRSSGESILFYYYDRADVGMQRRKKGG